MWRMRELHDDKLHKKDADFSRAEYTRKHNEIFLRSSNF